MGLLLGAINFKKEKKRKKKTQWQSGEVIIPPFFGQNKKSLHTWKAYGRAQSALTDAGIIYINNSEGHPYRPSEILKSVKLLLEIKFDSAGHLPDPAEVL